MRIYNKWYLQSERGHALRKQYRLSEKGRAGKRIRDKRYRKTILGRIRQAKANAKYRQNHPQKYVAHTTMSNGIRDGKIVRQTCEICGNRAEGHHPDYSQPLAVKWLCPAHHRQEHKPF
jgi:hypothetical protein